MKTRVANPSISQYALSILLASLFIVLPLLYSGRTLLALFLLELIGFGLILMIGWSAAWRQQMSRFTWVLLCLVIAIPLLYLIPLPQEWWLQLSGRERYQAPLDWLQQHGLMPTPYLAASIIPYKTVHAFLAVLPLVAIVVATASLTTSQRHTLVKLFLLLASFQAVLALVQYTNPDAEFLKWLGADTGRSSQGTYRNRDHLATFMIIALPLATALMLYSIGLKETHHRSEKSHEWRISTSLFYLLLVLLILLGAVFTRSRAGVALAILALLITLPVFARHIGGRTTLGVTASIVGLGAAIAASIGLIPVLNRFIVANPAEDERWRIFNTTIEGIKQFFPWGSGPGTFQEIYRNFQPIEQLSFINHAHNDYLELILETGLIGLLALLLTLVVYMQGWIRMWGDEWDQERIIKTAAGLSLLLFMLHASLEFTTHTPANAVFLAFLAGLFLKTTAKH